MLKRRYINVRGIFSDPRQVPLVNVHVKMCGDANCENMVDGMTTVCVTALLKEVTHDMVLPIDVVADSQRLPVMNVMYESVLANDASGVSIDEDNDDNSDEDVVLNADQLPAGNCVNGDTDLRKIQEKDDKLCACWEMAKAGKGDCIIDDGLLYHTDQVEGQRVSVVCS